MFRIHFLATQQISLLSLFYPTSPYLERPAHWTVCSVMNQPSKIATVQFLKILLQSCTKSSAEHLVPRAASPTESGYHLRLGCLLTQ